MDAHDQELDGLRHLLKSLKNGKLVMKLNRVDVTAREIEVLKKEIAAAEALRKRADKAA